jgi:ribosomal-protein-alanine N-acetyltransferase
LLQSSVYAHHHSDWRLPGEWLGWPGFVVYDMSDPAEVESRPNKRRTSDLNACLVVAADPLPAAWVRLAAVRSRFAFDQVQTMFDRIVAELDPAVDEIAWFLTDYWPHHWIEGLGFAPVSEVVTYRKDDVEAPAVGSLAGLLVRPLLIEDIPALVAIEAAAFEPRWRHGADDLYQAWRQALSFEVALLDGAPVAFQFSTVNGRVAHLSRMTVHPDRQGLGIGAVLLASALKSYRRQNVHAVTLNTQVDNGASRRLYERFGFLPTGDSYPVLAYYPRRVPN